MARIVHTAEPRRACRSEDVVHVIITPGSRDLLSDRLALLARAFLPGHPRRTTVRISGGASTRLHDYLAAIA